MPRRTKPELQHRKLEAELARCIDRDQEQARQLLRQIRRLALWRTAYQTWNEYLEKRWDIYE